MWNNKQNFTYEKHILLWSNITWIDFSYIRASNLNSKLDLLSQYEVWPTKSEICSLEAVWRKYLDESNDQSDLGTTGPEQKDKHMASESLLLLLYPWQTLIINISTLFHWAQPMACNASPCGTQGSHHQSVTAGS